MVLSEREHNATVTAIVGQSITVTDIVRKDGGSLAAGFGFADWFKLGYAERNDTAGNPLRAEVLASTAIASGEITLTLGRVLGCSVGDVIVVVPGCDKQRTTCSAYDAVNNPHGVFDNLPNFGGWADMPATSPSLKIPNTSKTPAKK
jgi:hypothetical protein